ncbi:uncharacterized protein [Procambarus clarkii]|uniref:uncharacterized protein n=1 Tax=Procambarus clarkii TaxID=6728 RepID=UPI001E675937|nr:uncharacterized protein LOC123744988 [Procambarus clarkii]
MKSLLAVVLVGMCSAAVVHAQQGTPCAPEISENCPATDPEDPVYLDEPTNCKEYCVCSGGVAYLFECGPDTLFNDVDDVCDWAETVDCGDRPTPEPESTTSPPVTE